MGPEIRRPNHLKSGSNGCHCNLRRYNRPNSEQQKTIVIALIIAVKENDNTGTIESMPTLISLLSLNIRFELMGKHMKSILTKVIELNWFSKKLSIQLGTPNGRKLRPCVVNH